MPQFSALPLTTDFVRDLRSDHAGEAGAVRIYDGVLAVTRHPEVRQFALTHRETERRHLAFFDAWLPRHAKSRLLPVWRASGWLLGASAALFGRDAVFAMVKAVETFVDDHYRLQIEAMQDSEALTPLVARLNEFRDDECEHRDDAADRLGTNRASTRSLYGALIGTGSALGVAIARRV
ncbi:MAG: demethoxyubiquinone hydroxylase family protein [Pseudomonadota bacterium]